MKKLALLFLIVFLFSCEKQNCYECNMRTIKNIEGWGYEVTGDTTTLQCGFTNEDAKAFEKTRTSTSPCLLDGHPAIENQTTNCTEKQK